ncbi:MAG: glycosyltransferase [Blastocatellia bacterium]
MTSNSSRIGVLHLTDTLAAGGLERVAVNLVNALPRERYQPYLGTTRNEGPLAGLIAADVRRLSLQRRRTLDVAAIQRLARYVCHHDIRLIHAHGTALFMARAAAALCRRVAVIWHDHYGRYLEHERPVWLYRAATMNIGGVIAVNEPLATWARRRLNVPAARVWYVPNFVSPKLPPDPVPELPGCAVKRIVCVANLRPQKDHLTLIRAMKIVVQTVPDAQLLLVGGAGDMAHLLRIQARAQNLHLTNHISWLGERHDVEAIQRACQIGVLSSASEGLPLALIEYGMAGLAVVATNVGQCAEVLDDGRAGRLVPPGQPEALAAALIALLQQPAQARVLGEALQQRVRAHYSADVVMRQISHIYEQVVAPLCGLRLPEQPTDLASLES